MTTLKGMTWSHARGYDPMVATSALWRERTGVAIEWDKRSLQDFESFPVAELARSYDLIVIDHPHVGQITDEGCLAPLDGPDRAAECAALSRASVGGSYASYNWRGRQWALPIDAAAQVLAYRADLVASPPADWGTVLDLARAGRVVVPMRPPHSLMLLFTLCANLGRPCPVERGQAFLDQGTGERVLTMLAELAALLDPRDFERDPIAASELLAAGPGPLAVMPFGYGYVSYAIDGFRPHRLSFADIPVPGASGSALGGTGIAVSAFSAHVADAKAYAFWVASGDVQKGPYAVAGGQPGNADAWEDTAVNATTHDFYRGTRQTLERSYVRPRHKGYMAFQQRASERLNAGLLAREAPARLRADLNTLFEESF